MKAKCICSAGYGDPLCNTVVNWCDTTPCGVHGYCDLNADDDFYFCTCDQNWEGKHCETEILDCRRTDLSEYRDYCGPHGTCVVNELMGQHGLSKAVCECSESFTGEKCDTDIDECTEHIYLCDKDHGHCTNEYGYYKCSCNAGEGKTRVVLPKRAQPSKTFALQFFTFLVDERCWVFMSASLLK